MRTKPILLICAIALSLGALPVFAGGPLLLFDPSTRTPLAYFAPVDVYTDLGGFGPLTNAEADVLTANGFAQWTAVPTASFSAAIAGDFSAVGLPDIVGANANLVVNVFNGGGIHVMYDDDGSITSGFFGAPPGVLGIASPDFALGTGEIVESWAMVNGTAVDPADLAPIPGASFGGVFTHEFGHSINLAHTQTNGGAGFFGDSPEPPGCGVLGGGLTFAHFETMYPFLDPSAGSVGIDQSTVDLLDDIASISNVYPGAGWPGSFGTITGKIFLSDGSTEITGVNVIARNVADPFGDCISALSGDFTQGDLGPDGLYTLNGLTPGATYAVYIDAIIAGGFSTPPVVPLPGPEEFYNGASESNDVVTDAVCDFTGIVAVAGSPSTADIVFNGSAGTLNLGDDDFEEVDLPFTFTFCGDDYTSVFVGSNGFLTFGGGDTDFSESVAELQSQEPRIAGMWDDLSPNQGGVVTAEEVAGNFVVTFTDVPQFAAGDINTFSMTLRSDNTFEFSYGQIDATDGLVGASPGKGLASDPGEIDLSAAPQPITGGAPGDMVYEFFSDADNDLDNLTLDWAECPDFELVIEPATEGVCYASTGAADGGRLLSIDVATGAGTLIGSSGLGGVPGLAINSHGEIYGTARISGDLYRIDAVTGQAFFVGATGVGFMDAIAFDENDVLYGVGFDPPAFNLRTIDTATGASTIVGPTGDVYVGMTFDPADGALYASVGGFQPVNPDGIARIDKNTGAATVLGATGLGGATPDLKVVDGVLYGSKGGGQNINNLIAIDKNTGAGSIVGPIGFAAVSGLATFAKVDVTPPELTLELSQEVLWPPNHKPVTVTVIPSILDDCDPFPTYTLLSVTSDEPDNAEGIGDGDTDDDIVIVDDITFELRSERAGTGDGRKYTITYEATDASGNSAVYSACVTVPHNQPGNAFAAGGLLGAGIEENALTFRIVIPSVEGLDARTIDPTRSYVGNQTGVAKPVNSQILDIDGDRDMDLLLTYPAEPVRQIKEQQVPGLKNPIGLHYTTTDDRDFLVKNIFGVEFLADAGDPGVVGDDAAEGIVDGGDTGTSGATYDMLHAGERVQVDIFTVTGRKVRSFSRTGMPLDDPSMGWDGRDSGGRHVSGGIYFYRITTPTEQYKRKIMITRR